MRIRYYLIPENGLNMIYKELDTQVIRATTQIMQAEKQKKPVLNKASRRNDIEEKQKRKPVKN